MDAALFSREIDMTGRGLRGESYADIARRLGFVGSISIDWDATDQEVIDAMRADLVEIVEAGGYVIVDPVETATAAGDGNIALTGEQTIAGVTTSTSRVLITDNTTASENGIWVTAAGAWTRATDFDQTAEVVNGAMIIVSGGHNAGRFVLRTANPITVGTTGLDFAVLDYRTASKIITDDGDSVQDALDSYGLRVSAFGPIGTADDSATIQAAIDAAAAVAASSGARAVVNLNGLHLLQSGITVKTGVHLRGLQGLLKANAAITTMVQVESGAWFTNCDVDANSLASRAVVTTDSANAKILFVNLTKPIYGFVIENSSRDTNDTETTNFEIGWCTVTQCTNATVYPVWGRHRASKRLRGGKMHDIIVEGVEGASYPAGTADQLELQGLDDWDLWNIYTINGGEIGIAISQCSTNVRGHNIVARGCDGQGIQIGSSYSELTLASVAGIAAGDLLIGQTSGASSPVEYVWATAKLVTCNSQDGLWTDGETVKICLKLDVNSAAGFVEGNTVLGGTSGAKGVIERILGTTTVTGDHRIYVSWNGVDDSDFVTGETISDLGTAATATIEAMSHDPAPATLGSTTITGITFASNITIDGAVAVENGNNWDETYIILDEAPALWSYGATITGVTSGATAEIFTTNSPVVSISMLSGHFDPDGEDVTDGTNVYSLLYVAGYFAGLRILCAQRSGFLSYASYDKRAHPKQVWGVHISNSTDVVLGEGLVDCLLGETYLNATYSFLPKAFLGDVSITKRIYFERGSALNITSNTISPDGTYHHVYGPGTINTIEAGADGQILILHTAVAGDGVVIANAAAGGNIDCAQGDLTMTQAEDVIVLAYSTTTPTTGRWRVIAFNLADRVAKFTREDADRNLTNTASMQALFTKSSVALPTGVYTFKARMSITGMSATSGNADLDILGAGTAVLTKRLMTTLGRDNATQPGTIAGSSVRNANRFSGDVLTAAASTEMFVIWEGEFEVTTAGTIIPSILLTTASAAVLKAGSCFTVQKIAEAGVTSIGDWS